MRYLSKGKRGIVYLREEKGKKVVVKKERDGSNALRALHNEAYWLQELNKHGIGPTFLCFDEKGLVMEYIKGIPFVEWHPRQPKRAQQRAIKDIFQQCRQMDVMRVSKFEMHHPVKHILIRKGKPVMIDFERCKKTMKPKNVTQFCQFLLTLGYAVDRDELRRLLQQYKKAYRQGVFKDIADLFAS